MLPHFSSSTEYHFIHFSEVPPTSPISLIADAARGARRGKSKSQGSAFKFEFERQLVGIGSRQLAEGSGCNWGLRLTKDLVTRKRPQMKVFNPFLHTAAFRQLLSLNVHCSVRLYCGLLTVLRPFLLMRPIRIPI